MTVQPHGAVPPPAPVADRRSPERRSLERRAEDRTQFARAAVAAAVAVCGGLVFLFLFFWVLGAIDVTDAVAATVVVAILAAVWLGGLIYRRRQMADDRAAQRTAKQDRERRGF